MQTCVHYVFHINVLECLMWDEYENVLIENIKHPLDLHHVFQTWAVKGFISSYASLCLYCRPIVSQCSLVKGQRLCFNERWAEHKYIFHKYLWDIISDVHRGQQRTTCKGSGPAWTFSLHSYGSPSFTQAKNLTNGQLQAWECRHIWLLLVLFLLAGPPCPYSLTFCK